MITAYQSGAQIVLEPNPYWAGPKPGFKHIVIKLIDNTAALQANLLSGDVDMVNGEGVGLTIDQVIAMQKQHPDQFSYIFKPSLNYEHIDLQKNNPILADLRVRKALLMAIDRETMVQKLFEGKQPVAATWVNPLEANYSKDAPTYRYDPAKAKALLAEAGWKPGSDGICRNAAGRRCRSSSAPPPAIACASCRNRCCRASGRRPACRSPSRTSRRAPCSVRR